MDRFIKYALLAFFLIYFPSGQALPSSIAEKDLRARSDIWNKALAARDTSTLLTILSDDVQMAAGGGKWQTPAGTEKFFKSLFERRPDITWINEPTDIQVNPVWDVACVTGNWIEGWTEKDGDAIIRGKYFSLWKLKDGVWLLHAAIFTPLSCTGASSYCQRH